MMFRSMMWDWGIRFVISVVEYEGTETRNKITRLTKPEVEPV